MTTEFRSQVKPPQLSLYKIGINLDLTKFVEYSEALVYELICCSSLHTPVNLMTFSSSPLSSILLNADSNLTSHVMLACGWWFESSKATWLPCSKTRCIFFWPCILVEPVLKRVGTERVQEARITWRRPCAGKARRMLFKRRHKTSLMAVFIQFDVAKLLGRASIALMLRARYHCERKI